MDEIIKRIKSATYRVNTSQLIADVFECGAISIANTVAFPQNQEREERYKQIMEKYEPAERQLLCEIFGMVYALLSSVVYDNGIFKYALACGIIERNPVALIQFKRAERQNRESFIQDGN